MPTAGGSRLLRAPRGCADVAEDAAGRTRQPPAPPRAELCSLFSVTILNNCQRGRGWRGGGYKYEHVTPQARTTGLRTACRLRLWGDRSDPPSGHARHVDLAALSGRVGCNPSPKPLRKV